MTYGEVRRLLAEVVRSNGRFLVWSARSEALPATPDCPAPEPEWVVVFIDTARGQTYEVRDYGRLVQDFPALPDVSEPGLTVGWHATEALVDGRMGWGGVRLAVYAVEQAYPACQLVSIEHGAHGWACVLACAPAVHAMLRTISGTISEVYVPGDEHGFVTALTLEAARDVARACLAAS